MEVIDKITESLNDRLNDKYYIDHSDGTKSFTLKREDGRQKKHLKRQKTYLKHYKLIEAASYLLRKK